MSLHKTIYIKARISLLLGILLTSIFMVALPIIIVRAQVHPHLDRKWDFSNNLGETRSGVLLADINGDGQAEVIVPTAGRVVALDENGTEIWRYSSGLISEWNQAQMADLDGDGDFEIVNTIKNSGILVLHANNGTQWWQRTDLSGPQPSTGDTTCSPVVADIDGDGYKEIFTGSEDIELGLEGTGRLTSLSYDGEILHQTFTWRPCAGGLSVADTDHDGEFEVYMGDRGMYMGGAYGKGIRSFWARNLTVRWNHPDPIASSHIPMLADVNKDGILDVIAGEQRGGLMVLKSESGSAIRKEYGQPDLFPIHFQPSVYDVDGDGNLEILMADYHDSLTDDTVVWDLVEWKEDGRMSPGRCYYGPTLGDVDGDGVMDIIVATFNGLYVYDREYNLIDEIPTVDGLGPSYLRALNNPMLADIDGDGKNELVVSQANGNVYAYDTDGITPNPPPRSWVQFYSERRLGAQEYVPPPGQTPEPMISNPFPSHKAVNVPASLSKLEFTIKDHQGNLMNYTVTTSPDIGSESDTDVSSGTKISVPISGPLDYSTTYTWQVKVTDGSYWSNRTFSFRTEYEPVSNQPPTHDDPFLEGGAQTTEDDLVCYNQTTVDDDGDEVTNIYNWYRNDVSLNTLLLSFDTKNATTAKDHSGNGNEATIRGPTWTSDGVVGGCYEFDGDGCIMIPHSSSLGGDGAWSEITLEHWIYLSHDQDGTRTISKIPSYQIGFSTGSINRIYAGVWTNSRYRETSSYSLNTNTWYHVVMTYKDGEGITLYINGTARRSRSLSGIIRASAGSRPETHEPLYLGWFDFFEGKIDDVRIYPNALSPEQIYERYLETRDGLSSNSTIVSQETTGGDEWICKVTPNDGLIDGEARFSNTITLVNTAPVASNLRFAGRTREFRLATDNLIAAYNYYDADGDLEDGTEIRWYKDDVLQEDYNDLTEVPSAGTVADEDWYFTVRPSDGEDFGTQEASPSILIIENYPPAHDYPLLVSSGGTDRADEDLICYNQTTIDDDGDEVTNIYNWYRNNVSFTNLLLPFDIDDAMTVKDYSGYGNDGTISGATWTSDGIVGGAYSFDGDDVITIEDDATLDGNNTWSEISIEFWVKTAAPLHGTRIVAKKVASASTGSYMVGFQTSMGDPANTVFWGINNGTDWQDIWNTTTTVLETGKWYQVICTYKSGPGLTIYINGIQRVNRPLTGNITRDPDGEPLFLGYDGGGTANRYLTGTLDEVRIYPMALTPAQIFQRYIETKDGLSNSSTIVPQETTAGDEWKCEITPNDSWQDGTAKTSDPLTVLQVSGNSRPRIDMFIPTDTTPEVNEGSSLNFTHTSSDPDGEPLSYSWLLDDVEQATSQNWTYTLGFDAAGTHNVTLIVSDPGGLSDSQQWIVTVNDVNRTPVIDTYYLPTDPTIFEGESQEFNITYHDPDGDSLIIQWYQNGSLVGSDDSYIFVADYDSAGVYNVTVAVSDGLEEVSHEWTLAVLNVNRPPVIDTFYPLSNPTISEGESQEFNVTKSDADGDPLTVSWFLNGTLLGETSDSYIFPAELGSAGVYNITVAVSDGLEQVSHEWMLTVEAPPIQFDDDYLVVRGLNDRVYYRIYNTSSGSWEGWNVVPNGATCDSPAAAVCCGRLHIVVRGMDGYSLWYGWINLTDNTFYSWTRLSGGTPSAPTLTSNGTALYLVVRGFNNRIYFRSYDCASHAWEQWNAVPTGAACDSPAAAMVGGSLHVVVRGMDEYSLWHGYLTNPADPGSFSGWTRLSGSTPSAPTLASNGTALSLVVRGFNDRIYYRIYEGSWEEWTVLPDATCDSPAAALLGNDLHIVVRGLDGNTLWHGYLADLSDPESFSGWSWLSGATSSAPTLTS